jgi:hypothetical protein
VIGICGLTDICGAIGICKVTAFRWVDTVRQKNINSRPNSSRGSRNRIFWS